TPVLLIVGAEDRLTLQRSSEAVERLPRGAVLIRVPRTGARFDEPGSLGLAAEHIVSWIDRLEIRPRIGDAWDAERRRLTPHQRCVARGSRGLRRRNGSSLRW